MIEFLQERREKILRDQQHAKARLPENIDLWERMREEAAAKAAEEPILGSYFHATVLNHASFQAALSFRLASKLDTPMLPTMMIRDVIEEAMAESKTILGAAEIDVLATYYRLTA